MANRTYRLVTIGEDVAGAQVTYDDADSPITLLRFQAQNNHPTESFYIRVSNAAGTRVQEVTLAPGQTINRAIPQTLGERLVVAFRNQNLDGVEIRSQLPAPD